jgi:hypothetical protein
MLLMQTSLLNIVIRNLISPNFHERKQYKNL